MSDLVDMSNEEWLAAVHALIPAPDEDDAALDYIYDSIDDAGHAKAFERIDSLIAWLDPRQMSTVCGMAVLSISRHPMADFYAMLAGLDPAPRTSPTLEAYSRRLVDTVREREPARDLVPLLGGLVDDALLCGEVVRDG